MSHHDHDAYVLADAEHDKELQRIRTIEANCDAKTRRHMIDLGLAPGFHCLDGIPRFRNKNNNRRVGGTGNIQFRLANTDRFKDDNVFAGSIKNISRLDCFLAQPSETSAGRHASDENSFIHLHIRHANAVAK